MSRGVALAVLLLTAACTPAGDTIGGPEYTAEALGRLKAEAEAACEQRRQPVPPHPFTTDGCSMWPDSAWQACCVAHDVPYWCGGIADDRRQADEQLRGCVADKGSPGVAAFMYWGVRAGGHPWLPFPWRWGLRPGVAARLRRAAALMSLVKRGDAGGRAQGSGARRHGEPSSPLPLRARRASRRGFDWTVPQPPLGDGGTERAVP
ncbi:MAG TPA: hypothetical protein VGD07_02135, partial [Methylomirabilota bacterium]